jgi:hypothetical protein
MKNPFKRKASVYYDERQRLLEAAKLYDPSTAAYHEVMSRIDQLDKILNRTTELTKTVIPALGAVSGVAAIYALQQFAGVIVPKTLEALNNRSPKKSEDLD